MSGIDFYISNIEDVTLPAMRKELELFEFGQLRSGKREVSGQCGSRVLHHRSNQTRNRHGWRCLAERKLRLRVRQYGERYLWFESISLRHELRI